MQSLEPEEAVAVHCTPRHGHADEQIGDQPLSLPRGPPAKRVPRSLWQGGGKEVDDFRPRADAHLPQVFEDPPLDGVVLDAPPVP